jgi:hypothetical protein
MTDTIVPFAQLPSYIKWLKKRVEETRGQDVNQKFRLVLKRARGRLKHDRRYRAGKANA